jgi:2-methylisocitrate lyase-like PEP mutase family enzyme
VSGEERKAGTVTAFDEFRSLHRPGRPLVLPNAWDHASGAALVAAGFPAIGTTSLGVAAAHGLPDGAGRTGAASLALTRLLARLPCLVTVDVEADGAAAAEAAAAGAVGVNIEDGLPGGGLADAGERAAMIRAVKAATPELFVNARIDAYWQAAIGLRETPPVLAEVIERANAYVAAGADGVFVPALPDGDDIRRLVDAVPAPVNVLYAPGRSTVDELARLGVARISTGSLLFRAAVGATVRNALAVAAGEPVDAGIPGYSEVDTFSGPR